jgi:hypothetical protein
MRHCLRAVRDNPSDPEFVQGAAELRGYKRNILVDKARRCS